MKVCDSTTVPIYTISGADTARALPDWLARRRKRSLKDDPSYANRVELLQDFEFPTSSVCTRFSEDGNYLMSTGTYKPCFHVHYLPHLSLSFERHTTSLNKTFLLLSPDCSKSLHLQTDRSIHFYTRGGILHHEVRLPRYGRDLVYDRLSTEALVPSAGFDADGYGEVFRLNLEYGRFMKSYQVDLGGQDETVESGLQGSIDVASVNTAAAAEHTHNLLAFGTSLRTIEFFDPRSKSRVATVGGHNGEVTALDFAQSGLELATGSSTGQISLFDLRGMRPRLAKNQGYGCPIQNLVNLRTASDEKKILSSDKRSIKIWDELTGDSWATIEPTVDLNFVTVCPGTGMVVTANEGGPQHAYFCPQMGRAPLWCSFLDNMVEEMSEEVPTETYHNYKFLTNPELKSLSLAHLVGKTNLLRPYMHGYFVASKLYDQARLIANPYQWEEERTKRVKEKVEKERASRIRGNKKVKVNQRLVDKIINRQENREVVDSEVGVLGDNRFSKLFEEEDYVVDENSKEFQALNPASKRQSGSGSGMDANNERQGRNLEENTNDGSEDEEAPIRKQQEDVSMRVSSSVQSRSVPNQDRSLGSRVHKSGRIEKSRKGDVVGERTVTFVPESKKKHSQQPPTRPKPNGQRRSASTNTFRQL